MLIIKLIVWQEREVSTVKWAISVTSNELAANHLQDI